MIWNYRIIRHCSEEREDWFGLHEVYYDEAGAICGWTSNPLGFSVDESEGPAGLIESLEQALRDARKYPAALVERGDRLEQPRTRVLPGKTRDE